MLPVDAPRQCYPEVLYSECTVPTEQDCLTFRRSEGKAFVVYTGLGR